MIPKKSMERILLLITVSIVSLFKVNAQAGGVNCGSAQEIFCGSSYSSATTGTGGDGFVSCGTEGTGGQRWYFFTAPGTGNVTLSLCTGTSYDSRVHVYTGACGALNCLVQNDDFCGLQSQVGWAVTQGTTYFIRIGGFFGAAGAFTATLTCNIPIGGCTQTNACNFNPLASFDNGSCDYSCYGCTYSVASNYNPLATIDNGSCQFELVQAITDGCIDPTACNFCSVCTVDDGSCDYTCLGCTYPNAVNYNPAAEKDDGSCIYGGCTDVEAFNFNPIAQQDDGSCIYDNQCAADVNQDGVVGVADIIGIMTYFGNTCN